MRSLIKFSSLIYVLCILRLVRAIPIELVFNDPTAASNPTYAEDVQRIKDAAAGANIQLQNMQAVINSPHDPTSQAHIKNAFGETPNIPAIQRSVQRLQTGRITVTNVRKNYDYRGEGNHVTATSREGSISFGPRFHEKPPRKMIGTLIHEAHHALNGGHDHWAENPLRPVPHRQAPDDMHNGYLHNAVAFNKYKTEASSIMHNNPDSYKALGLTTTHGLNAELESKADKRARSHSRSLSVQPGVAGTSSGRRPQTPLQPERPASAAPLQRAPSRSNRPATLQRAPSRSDRPASAAPLQRAPSRSDRLPSRLDHPGNPPSGSHAGQRYPLRQDPHVAPQLPQTPAQLTRSRSAGPSTSKPEDRRGRAATRDPLPLHQPAPKNFLERPPPEVRAKTPAQLGRPSSSRPGPHQPPPADRPATSKPEAARYPPGYGSHPPPGNLPPPPPGNLPPPRTIRRQPRFDSTRSKEQPTQQGSGMGNQPSTSRDHRQMPMPPPPRVPSRAERPHPDNRAGNQPPPPNPMSPRTRPQRPHAGPPLSGSSRYRAPATMPPPPSSHPDSRSGNRQDLPPIPPSPKSVYHPSLYHPGAQPPVNRPPSHAPSQSRPSSAQSVHGVQPQPPQTVQGQSLRRGRSAAPQPPPTVQRGQSLSRGQSAAPQPPPTVRRGQSLSRGQSPGLQPPPTVQGQYTRPPSRGPAPPPSRGPTPQPPPTVQGQYTRPPSRGPAPPPSRGPTPQPPSTVQGQYRQLNRGPPPPPVKRASSSGNPRRGAPPS